MFMAIRGASSISTTSKLLLQNYRLLKPLTTLSSTTTPPSTIISPDTFSETPTPTTATFGGFGSASCSGFGSRSGSLLSFEDSKDLFASISTAKLLKSTLTLKMAAVETVVDLGTWVINSKLMNVGVFKDVVMGFTKCTFYDHFVAGRNVNEAGETVKMLWDDGFRGMLDYGLEHVDDNQSCDRNSEAFINTVDSTKSLPATSVSSVVVKITAICPVSILRRISDLLRWEYKTKSNDLPWKQNTLPIFSESSPLYHTLTKPEPLTPQEEQDFRLAQQRLTNIIEKCLASNVPLVIDAEDTQIQPAIDYFTHSAAILYNKGDKPLIFGTIQAYLKDAKERLVLLKAAADEMGLPLGVKLVRGAYMSSEAQVAAALGHESPIHNGIKQTHACYNDCASFMLHEIANGPGALVLATHNFESGRLAALKAQELGIANGNQKVQFAQLYGMAEALSYGLRNAGFEVSKYLPFGPVDQIMPYLLRRAEENKGMLSSSAIDRQLMRMELKRRLAAAVL
ncbi:proline dehydrogenase 2, mitochondrial-like [Apium graveolens]|uniref:proline dehydrogenase 2, mitochondrial-like n=1 Tax=Apium graveolens TaxID=4045 RepID=UPI003D79D772